MHNNLGDNFQRLVSKIEMFFSHSLSLIFPTYSIVGTINKYSNSSRWCVMAVEDRTNEALERISI